MSSLTPYEKACSLIERLSKASAQDDLTGLRLEAQDLASQLSLPHVIVDLTEDDEVFVHVSDPSVRVLRRTSVNALGLVRDADVRFDEQGDRYVFDDEAMVDRGFVERAYAAHQASAPEKLLAQIKPGQHVHVDAGFRGNDDHVFGFEAVVEYIQGADITVQDKEGDRFNIYAHELTLSHFPHPARRG